MNNNFVGAQDNLYNMIPCGACRLLRRMCTYYCPFAPYFPPNDPQKFWLVHTVYGERNVARLLMEMPLSQRADTVNSLVFEAVTRLRDPVYGSVGLLINMHHQFEAVGRELNAARSELMRYRHGQIHAAREVTVAFPPPVALQPQHQAISSSSIRGLEESSTSE